MAINKHMKAKEMQFVNDVTRTVFVIRVSEKSELEVMEVARNLFPDKQKDFVVNISDNEVALVKEVKPTVEEKDLKKIAKSLEDTINSELMVRSKIGIGSIVSNIKNIARSFKEGQIAIDVGSVFDADKTVLNYKNLGIGRLIYQLPTTLCEMFISEVFKQGAIENLDQETLLTIQKFFENNLNVSETSRKLFVHRNTLVYRLEKMMALAFNSF
jgi:carbohydrate diacid regulator